MTNPFNSSAVALRLRHAAQTDEIISTTTPSVWEQLRRAINIGTAGCDEASVCTWIIVRQQGTYDNKGRANSFPS